MDYHYCLGNRFFAQAAQTKNNDIEICYEAQKGIEVIGYVLIGLLILIFFTVENLEKLKEMVERYYIENAKLESTLTVGLTDNWIELDLRYITGYKLRRFMKNQLLEQIEPAILKTQGKVILASKTLELLKIPEMTYS